MYYCNRWLLLIYIIFEILHVYSKLYHDCYCYGSFSFMTAFNIGIESVYEMIIFCFTYSFFRFLFKKYTISPNVRKYCVLSIFSVYIATVKFHLYARNTSIPNVIRSRYYFGWKDIGNPDCNSIHLTASTNFLVREYPLTSKFYWFLYYKALPLLDWMYLILCLVYVDVFGKFYLVRTFFFKNTLRTIIDNMIHKLICCAYIRKHS